MPAVGHDAARHDDISSVPADIDTRTKTAAIADAVNMPKEDVRPAVSRLGPRGGRQLAVRRLHGIEPDMAIGDTRLHIEVEHPKARRRARGHADQSIRIIAPPPIDDARQLTGSAQAVRCVWRLLMFDFEFAGRLVHDVFRLGSAWEDWISGCEIVVG